MMFKAAKMLPCEASQQMIEMARGLSMNAKWDAALRNYGVRALCLAIVSKSRVPRKLISLLQF